MRFTENDVIRYEIESLLMGLYTTIPAIVTNYNSTKQTVDVTVAVETPTYYGDNIAPHSLKNIPVIFPSASKWVMAGPISVGDAVVLLVPHYGTEEYLQGRKNQIGKPSTVNRHDINDAVAIVGMFTRNKTTINPAYKDTFHISNGNNVVVLDESNGATLLNGSASINIDNSGNIVADSGSSTVTIASNGEVTFDSNVTINGNLTVTGTTTTTGLLANGINMVLHTHPYTDNGSNLVTGPPAV